MAKQERLNILRYPGGKQKVLDYLMNYLPSVDTIDGRFVEPFVGGGAIFFAINPQCALLTDINPELIDLYLGIRSDPIKVWEIYKAYPSTKCGYYEIRDIEVDRLDLETRAARTLYLNRTCFKGMWRHNLRGQFNVGYGGQERRWVINKKDLIEASARLQQATLRISDFEKVIDTCSRDDFLFVDPPYRPGERDMTNEHYLYSKFGYGDYKRLAGALKRASCRNVKWAMTTSSHPEILDLFRGYSIAFLPKGTGKRPGIITNSSGEALICNYRGLP